MEWLSLLAGHPVALSAFLEWLKSKEAECYKDALDCTDSERMALRGRRDAFVEIIGYINNNLRTAERGIAVRRGA